MRVKMLLHARTLMVGAGLRSLCVYGVCKIYLTCVGTVLSLIPAAEGIMQLARSVEVLTQMLDNIQK
jgi:hypothetical protein